ncbi:MAG: sigma-70 family RNA polymerase sigma factor [Phycisphaerales bacterium]
MAAADSTELVLRCRAGDAGAWDALVERYARLVYSVPRRYGLAADDAEDVMQSVFVAAFQSMAQLKDPTKLSAWLITSAHRESWRVGRARGAIGPTGSLARHEGGEGIERAFEDLSAPPEALAERWETQDRVNHALIALGRQGGRCEELLRAIYFRRAETRYEAIAEELGIPIGSIGPTRGRCLKKLAELLRTDDAAPETTGDPVGRNRQLGVSAAPPSARLT